MKKYLFSSLVILLFFVATVAYAAVSLRCYNKDSRDYTFKVKIAGSTKDVTFEEGTTSVTIQGGSESAVIYTSCGEVTVKSGNYIEIKNGCISVR